MPNPVVHFELVTRDGAAAQTFYSDVFGWKVDASNPMNYGIVDTDSEEGISGGISSPEEGGGEEFITFYVQVDDPQAYLDKIEKAGGRTLIPVTEIPNMMTFAQFEDPQGNRVGLVKAEAM